MLGHLGSLSDGFRSSGQLPARIIEWPFPLLPSHVGNQREEHGDGNKFEDE